MKKRRKRGNDDRAKFETAEEEYKAMERCLESSRQQWEASYDLTEQSHGMWRCFQCLATLIRLENEEYIATKDV